MGQGQSSVPPAASKKPFENPITTHVTPVAIEILRIFPDALILMSGLFALITLSFPYAVFFGSMLEATAIQKLIAKGVGLVNLSYSANPSSFYRRECKTGFSYNADLSSLSLFRGSNLESFPSAPIFILSTAVSYFFTSLSNQSKELQHLGPAFSSRFYISLVLSLVFIVAFTTFRLWYGCDSFGASIFSIILGLILGYLLIQQNRRLFGKDGEQSVNLLGIPLLSNRAANGKRLYICPTK
jgi:hypothetical protein